LVTGLQNAATSKDSAATQQHLSDLANKQVVALQAMSDLRADSNLVLGLLTEGAGVPSKDLFPPLLDRFNAAANHLEKSLGALGSDKSASALHQPVEELLQDGRGDKSIFALRRAELDAAAAGEAALATFTPGSLAAATIRSFAAADHRRRGVAGLASRRETCASITSKLLVLDLCSDCKSTSRANPQEAQHHSASIAMLHGAA
jgi:hypothetical protein